MYWSMILSMFVSVSVAAPLLEDAQAKLLNYESNNDGQGNYLFSFETSNGIGRRESGRLVNIGQADEHIEVQGVYSYTDPEGQPVVVNYWADENGYHTDRESTLPDRQPEIPPAFAAPPALVASLLG